MGGNGEIKKLEFSSILPHHFLRSLLIRSDPIIDDILFKVG